MKKRLRQFVLLLTLSLSLLPFRFISAESEILIPQSAFEDTEIKELCGVSETNVYFKDNNEHLFAYDRRSRSLRLIQDIKEVDFSATYPTEQGLFLVTLTKQGTLQVQYDEASEREILYEKKTGVTQLPVASLDSAGIL